MEYYNPENRATTLWASLAVVLYALFLALLMLFVRFDQEAPESMEAGILVEFGEGDDGEGEEELLATDVVSTPPPPQVEQQEEAIEVDERSEVALPAEQVEQPKVAEPVEQEQPIEQRDTIIEEVRTVNQKALFPGRKEQSTATSQGSTSGSGNQGAESGGESGAAVGGGEGDDVNISFDLGGRTPVGAFPKPNNYGENLSGVVVISIIVDESGAVKFPTYKAQGSTTNNSELIAAAIAAAKNTRFTLSEKVIQEGTITYHFKLN